MRPGPARPDFAQVGVVQRCDTPKWQFDTPGADALLLVTVLSVTAHTNQQGRREGGFLPCCIDVQDKALISN